MVQFLFTIANLCFIISTNPFHLTNYKPINYNHLYISKWRSSNVKNPVELVTNEIICHNITSPYQEGETPIYVLLPKNYTIKEKYKVLYLLPPNKGNTYEAISLLKKLNIHNIYSIIIVQPSMTRDPWYGDHITNLQIRQSSYIKDFLVPFIDRNYTTLSSKDGRFLLGYSKSGWGAYSLITRYPDFFGYAAAWDAPMVIQNMIYGMDIVFGDINQMKLFSPYSLIQTEKSFFQNKKRLVLAGESAWGQLRPSPLRESHTKEMRDIMISNGIQFTYNNQLNFEHSWNKNWLIPVIKDLIALSTTKNKNEE